MRSRRISCLLTLFFFAFAVLAPLPLEAAQNERASVLSGVKEFLVKDWEQTKGDMRRLGDFLKRDFARTRDDVSAIRARLASLKLAVSGGDRGGRLHDRLQRLRETLVDRLDTTIDEMGIEKFSATVDKIAGVQVVAGAEGKDEHLVRARLARTFDDSLQVLFEEMEHSGPAAAVDAVREADGVVDQMARGATPEQLVKTLKDRHFGPDGSQGNRRGPGFFKGLGTILKSLFMVAACGGLSLVSLGILSYGLASGGVLFVAAGGAAVLACLYGVIYYVAAGIKRIRKNRPSLGPVPAFALEGMR